MKQDIAYWMNRIVEESGREDLYTLNLAVEESTLNDRGCGCLLDQGTLYIICHYLFIFITNRFKC